MEEYPAVIVSWSSFTKNRNRGIWGKSWENCSLTIITTEQILVYKVCLYDILNTDKVLFCKSKRNPSRFSEYISGLGSMCMKNSLKYVLGIFLIPATKCLAGHDWIMFEVLRSTVAWLTCGSHPVARGVWCIACSCPPQDSSREKGNVNTHWLLLSHLTQSGTRPVDWCHMYHALKPLLKCLTDTPQIVLN